MTVAEKKMIGYYGKGLGICPKCKGKLILVGSCYNSDPVEDQFKCERCGRIITITRLGAYE